jgi:hypothetical protein
MAAGFAFMPAGEKALPAAALHEAAVPAACTDIRIPERHGVMPIAVAFPSSSVMADPDERRGARRSGVEPNATVDRSNNRT